MIRISRREFIRAAATGIVGLVGATSILGRALAGSQDLTNKIYVPSVLRNDESGLVPSSRTVRVSGPAANWDFSTGWYGDYVDQDVADGMVQRGLRELTGAESVQGAWADLMPNYQVGQKVAIKVNLNNASCDDADNTIDANIQVVNALVSTLVIAGVAESDVIVYDARRPMPARFYSRRRHTSARFMGTACGDGVPGFSQTDPSLKVTFSHPNMKAERWLTDVLGEASYVINMPIMKRHSLHPVTLGFKNHFGSLSNLGNGVDALDNPHKYIVPGDELYDPKTLPFVDINANPNIANKTVLILGDGIFGASVVNAVPQPWVTFGNASPNSLFFSRDPVAIDCVMADFLRAEFGLWSGTAGYDYLVDAQGRGLGTYEMGAPWGDGYQRIDCRSVSL